MKKVFAYLAVSLLSAHASLHGAATSSTSADADRLHIPLAIFIDQKNKEPGDASDAPATGFQNSLNSSNQIILASSRLVWYSLKNNSPSDPFFLPKHTVYEIPMSSLLLIKHGNISLMIL